MKEAMNNFEGAVNELMDICKTELGRAIVDDEMDERTIKMLQLSFKLFNASMKLLEEQTDLLIEMNEKMDTLLKRRDLA